MEYVDAPILDGNLLPVDWIFSTASESLQWEAALCEYIVFELSDDITGHDYMPLTNNGDDDFVKGYRRSTYIMMLRVQRLSH